MGSRKRFVDGVLNSMVQLVQLGGFFHRVPTVNSATPRVPCTARKRWRVVLGTSMFCPETLNGSRLQCTFGVTFFCQLWGFSGLPVLG